MDGIKISMAIGLVFSPLAALLAFLLTYNEYQHHFPDNKKPIKMATEAAIFTFFIFMTISLLIGIILPSVVEGK